jgi:hypothetical protein
LRSPQASSCSRGGAERVSSGEQHAFALRLQPLRQLADRSRLSGAVHARDHDHAWPGARQVQRLLERRDDLEQGDLECALQARTVGDVFLAHLCAKAVDERP